MEIKRIFDVLPYALQKHDKKDALAGKKGGKWITWSHRDYIEKVNEVSHALIHLGIEKGDKIITLSGNRPEWNFADMGVLQTGAIHVPVFPTVSEEELHYILNETKAKYIFVSNKYLFNKAKHSLTGLETIPGIFTFDTIENAEHFSGLLQTGREHANPELLESRKATVTPADIASIIYTSGSTSEPKGVVLNHRNHVSNFINGAEVLNMNASHRVLSYLPLAHSYERTCNYIAQYLGISIYYTENITSILANFGKIKPNIVVTVPLLLEKIYEGILHRSLKTHGIKRFLINWSLKIGKSYPLSNRLSFFYKMKLKFADRLVFCQWREMLGGNMIKFICGGAALPQPLLRVFWAAKLPVYEGYGLTECSPLIAYNTEKAFRLGTIGKTIEGVSVKISDEGEVLCQGDNVMQRYFNKPDETAKVKQSDGWLHTGDLGELDKDGFLKLTGRKRDTFKILSGIYIHPETLENVLKLSPFIEQAMVYGTNRNFVSALIVPNFFYLKSWCENHGIPYSTNKEIVENENILMIFAREVEECNNRFKRSDHIEKFALLIHEWTTETGEISSSMKLKRDVIQNKYKTLLESFYTS